MAVLEAIGFGEMIATVKDAMPTASGDKLAEAVRAACLEAAREGYELAAMSGLCHEGALECSLDHIRGLDLGPVIDAAVHGDNAAS